MDFDKHWDFNHKQKQTRLKWNHHFLKTQRDDTDPRSEAWTITQGGGGLRRSYPRLHYHLDDRDGCRLETRSHRLIPVTPNATQASHRSALLKHHSLILHTSAQCHCVDADGTMFLEEFEAGHAEALTRYSRSFEADRSGQREGAEDIFRKPKLYWTFFRWIFGQKVKKRSIDSLAWSCFLSTPQA